MADVKSTGTVSWVAIVISLVALFVGVSAYNRAGTPVQTEVQDQAVDIRKVVEEQIAIAEARARLMVLKARLDAGLNATRLDAGLNAEEAGREVSQVRQDLSRVFADTQGTAKDQWSKIDSDLSQLEQKIRADSADALRSLEHSIRELRKGMERPK